MVAHPLLVRERLLGALLFTFAGERDLDGEQLSFLQALADQCALAVERARFRELAEREIAIHERSVETLRHTQRRLQEALSRTEQAVRARQDVLVIVSHDLRNPLAAIVMKANLIERLLGEERERGPATDQRVIKQSQGIVGAAHRMNRMVQDLLDLAKLEAGQIFSIEPAQREINELVSQAVQMIEPLADSGIGIPESEQPHILDPYWQVRQDRQGAGLGLSVAKRS
jgi:signal transduction histidine kinase